MERIIANKRREDDTVEKRIYQTWQNFLWKEEAWRDHCLIKRKCDSDPKTLGGLEILDLRTFNRALHLQWRRLRWKIQPQPSLFTGIIVVLESLQSLAIGNVVDFLWFDYFSPKSRQLVVTLILLSSMVEHMSRVNKKVYMNERKLLTLKLNYG